MEIGKYIFIYEYVCVLKSYDGRYHILNNQLDKCIFRQADRQLGLCKYMYIHVYIYIHTYKQTDRQTGTCIYPYIHTYINTYTHRA